MNAPVDILLVDDRPSNLSSLEAVLARPDYRLALAQSGPEALVQVLRPDLEFAVILLDVAMPGMDGFETARIIKERDRSKLIPIIFVTASVYDMEHIFRGYRVGAVDYLRKPVDPAQVRAKVAVFVELFRQRKEIERQGARLNEAERLLRERAEAALRESEAIYEHTFEHAPVGIGHATSAGKWTRTNRRLCEILGRTRDELMQLGVADIIDADGGVLETAFNRLASGQESVYVGEHPLATARPEPAWGHLILSPLRDPAGSMTRVIAVIDDVTERMRMELERTELVQELQRAVRARDDFLTIAAHELKTPITPLRLQTSSLVRELSRSPVRDLDPTRMTRRIRSIDESGRRLEMLVDRLLDVSRMSVGKLELETEQLDLAALAREVAARLREPAEQAGCEVTVHALDPVLGRWDRLRMDQVVANLLSNAIKYGDRRPIEISVTCSDERARLAVRDHGIGIPEAAQVRVFDRFERVVPMKHYGGFGLGLWIVRQIVEAHGGRVSVVSRPGEGAEFVVDVPREVVSAAPQSPSDGEAPPSGWRRVSAR